MMTTEDWLQLLESDSQLHMQMWEVLEYGLIRNVEGQCPLCAWASLHGCKNHYKGSWSFALREAFGKDRNEYWPDVSEAHSIEIAADRALIFLAPEHQLIRARLLRALNLKER